MSGNLKNYLAELFGTFALVFVGAGSVCMDAVTGGKIGPVGIALAHGLVLSAMCSAFGPHSGGHFNPALTLGLALQKRIEPVTAVFYAISQLLGAALAGLFLARILHNQPDLLTSAPFLGSCDLSGVGFRGATLIEAVATFFLVTVVYRGAADPENPSPAGPFAAGVTVAACVLAIGPLTGAALNPARAFGPALATGHWANWYVYWVGPAAGAVAAALVQEKLYFVKRTS